MRFSADDFLGGQRFNSVTDGRPDPRPDVRETRSLLRNLWAVVDFSPAPRPPLILPVHLASTLVLNRDCDRFPEGQIR